MHDEFSGLVYQFLYAGLAVAFLAIVVVLTTTNDKLWNVFAEQSDANSRLRDYAEFAAYDNAEVRGQELVSLIKSTKGDPFVVIFPASDGDPLVSYNDVTKDMQFANVSDCVNTGGNTTLNIAVEKFQIESATHTIEGIGAGSHNWNHSTALITTEAVQETLLQLGGNAYKSYMTCLVFENANASNVVGIIAMEVP